MPTAASPLHWSAPPLSDSSAPVRNLKAMKSITILLLSLAPAVADDCALLPGHPLITVDHADPLAHLPICSVNGSQTTITLQAPAHFDWESFQVGAGSQFVIVSSGGTGFASFHNVTTATPAVINGAITADGPFTLQQATGGQILIGQTGTITAPAVTLTTQRAADAIGYLRNGTGRFDAVAGTQPLLQVEGNLRATGGALKVIGSRLVQIGPHGKLEAPGQKVSVFAGPNATVQASGIAAAELVDGENNIVQHLGIARGFRVEMHAVPDSVFGVSAVAGRAFISEVKSPPVRSGWTPHIPSMPLCKTIPWAASPLSAPTAEVTFRFRQQVSSSRISATPLMTIRQ